MGYDFSEEELATEVRISMSEYERLSKHQEIEDIYKDALTDIYEILTNTEDFKNDIEEMKSIIRSAIMEVEDI